MPRKDGKPTVAELRATHSYLKQGVKWNVPCCAVDDDDPDWECRRYAIKGGAFCTAHGGDTAHNIAVANQRLSELRLRLATVTAPAAGRVIEKIMSSKKVAPETRLRAAQGVLSSVGIGPSSTVTIHADVNVRAPIDILVERLELIAARNLAAVNGAVHDEAVDAEEVG